MLHLPRNLAPHLFLLLRCSFDPSKCLVVIVLSCRIKIYYFLSLIPSSAGLSLQLFVPSFLTVSYCFLLIELIQKLILQFAGVVCWYIVCTNMNYKVMLVFTKRRFDVVLHTCNPGTGKFFHRHLTIFQRMWEIISSNMFYSPGLSLSLFAMEFHLSTG